MPFGFIHWLSSQLGTGSSRKVLFSLLTCVLADEALWHAVACALLSCLGVESFAGPEFGSPAVRRQEKPVGLSKAGAQSWTEGQQCEVGYRSFSAAALHRKISLKHRQHVSVTVDVHVRPCCYSSMFHWAMLIFRLQFVFSLTHPSAVTRPWTLVCPSISQTPSASPLAVWVHRGEGRIEAWRLNPSSTKFWSSTGELLWKILALRLVLFSSEQLELLLCSVSVHLQTALIIERIQIDARWAQST